jgi:DNA-binding winged helix-turn-helix (wHTH) protein/Tol biopolymer transport system component
MQQSLDREYQFGPFRFRTPERVLLRESQPIALTPKAADLLLVLLEGAGRLISKEDLIKQLWPDTFVTDGNLTFHIHLVRHALGETSERPEYIATVPKRGYRFIAPTIEVHPDESTPSNQSDPAPIPAGRATDGATIPPSNPVEGVAPSRRRIGWPAFTRFGVVALLTAVMGALALRVAESVPPRVGDFRQLTHDGGIKQGAPRSDGSRIFYSTMVSKRATAIPVHGGEPVLLAGLRDFVLQDLNSSGSEFLALKRDGSSSGGREVWAVPTLAHTARRVGDLLCGAAAWSPNGQQIVCADDNVLVIADAEGKARRQLASLPAAVESPRWSPDGRIIRFTLKVFADRTASESLWEVRTDGTDLHELLSGWNSDRACCGDWTPDGKLFVFEANRDGRTDLWALQESAGLFGRASRQPTRLTSGPMSFFLPAASSDGKAILAYGKRGRGELVRYDSTLRQFVPYLDGISAAWVTFSNDRESVAYISFPDNILWRARADGTDKRQLTFPPLEVAGLSWSPDGKTIAIRAGLPGKHKKVFLVPAGGGMPEPLTPADVEQGIPAWSPDGSRLVFGDVPETFGHPSGVEVLHVVDLRSRSMTTLPESGGLWTTRWSPDGRYISALTIDLKEQQRLRLFDCRTERWRSVDANHVSNTTWSRDSQYIYYDTEGHERALRRVRVADGLVEQITNLETYPVAHYGWSGLSLDGSPIILGQRFDVEIYALELERR